MNPGRLRLSAAINETVSFRFSMRVGGSPIRRPALRIGSIQSLDASLNPEVVTIFREHPVPLTDFPGWHVRAIPPSQREAAAMDVLVPIGAPVGGLPELLAAGEVYSFWVDLNVPKGSADGTYDGRIELLSAGHEVDTLGFELTVWPFVLPDEPAEPIIVELDHRALLRHHRRQADQPTGVGDDDRPGSPGRASVDQVLASTLNLLRRHRLTPVLPRLAPGVGINARGRLDIDWHTYDAIAEHCLDGQAFANGTPITLWALPVEAMFDVLRPTGTMTGSAGAGLLEDYLAKCASHFAERGWLSRSYALLGRGADHSDKSIRDFVSAAKRADPRIFAATDLWPQSLAPLGWTGYINAPWPTRPDLWAPPAQFFDSAALATERRAGRRTWLTVDRPPYSGSVSVYAPDPFARILTWQAGHLQADAIYVGLINDWPDAGDQPTPEDCLRADPHVLLFPGGPFGLNEPVPSVRLKRLRRSAQDGALRRLLVERGLGHIAQSAVESLAPVAGSEAYRAHYADARYVGWPSEPAVFDLARRVMAEELGRSVQGSPAPGSAASLGRTTAWRRLMLLTRKVTLRIDGSRVRVVGSAGSLRTEIESVVTIHNQTRLPVSGNIHYVDPPSSWQCGDGRTVSPIEPGESRRVTLVASAGAVPLGPNGTLLLPIRFETLEGERFVEQARIACVVAAPIETPIAVDGSLADWPPGATNVAADFRLISARAGAALAGGASSPRHATLAFVMRDRRNLYIAVNCAFDGVRDSAVQRSGVEYDDMIPSSGELVEFLIDPLNAGTHSPADLFHVVVKPSGSYFLEKGIRFDPPVGAREPWAAGVEVATRVSDGRWTIELKIPLDSFDTGTDAHMIWGFNVTRFEEVGREFSTWSGATGNAYDPLSLGNLYLP